MLSRSLSGFLPLPIDSIWAREVSDLGDAQLAITNLFIEEAWLQIVGVYIGLPSDYVVVDT